MHFLFYNSFAIFLLQLHLDTINIQKYIQAFSKLNIFLHRLEILVGGSNQLVNCLTEENVQFAGFRTTNTILPLNVACIQS